MGTPSNDLALLIANDEGKVGNHLTESDKVSWVDPGDVKTMLQVGILLEDTVYTPTQNSRSTLRVDIGTSLLKDC